MARTLDGLAERGNHVTVVAPVPPSAGDVRSPPGVEFIGVPTRTRSRAASLVDSVRRREPLAITRHRSAAVAAAVRSQLATSSFDIVHVEQLQAMPQAQAALGARVPVVLRAQNVESDLWRRLAEVRPAWRLLATREANRLAIAEAEAVRRAALTLAVTGADADRLRALSGGSGRVEVLKVPMPRDLPPAPGSLPGHPAVVMLAGRWLPNRDGAEWFLRECWESIARELPEARLHVFGERLAGPVDRVDWHPAPEQSGDVFVEGSIHVAPLRIASGARVRILEAWARGIPVVATPQAAAGLDVADGEGLRLASTPGEFAGALRDLTDGTAAQVVAAGRERLAAWHDPGLIARQLETYYQEACRRSDV